MQLVISECKTEGLFINETINFMVSDYESLKNINTKEDIIKWLIYNDKMFSAFILSKEKLDVIYSYVTGDIQLDELKKQLCGISNYTFIMLLNRINSYYKKGKALINQEITDIVIICNKQNLLKVLSMNLTGKNITLESNNITFKDFYNLLTGIDLKKYDDLGIKINIKESSKSMTLSRLYSIVLIVKSLADKINNMNLSNLEKIIYVYDIVKERIYKENPDDLDNARDIDSVLLGENIVCVGYARLINVLSSFLNINSVMLISKKEKHAINLIYIKDEKYNIDGFLTFDATVDSRTDITDKNYIRSYMRFANTTTSAIKRLKIDELQEINISIKELSQKIADSYEEKQMYLEAIQQLFRMSGKENYKELLNNIISYDLLTTEEKEVLKREYESLINKLFNTSIDMNTFIKALYNTRRIEYYIGMIPEINISDIDYSSLNWKWVTGEFEKDDEAKILFQAVGHDYLDKNRENLISSSLKDNPSTERDILNMRLVKVLKKELQRKSN